MLWISSRFLRLRDLKVVWFHSTTASMSTCSEVQKMFNFPGADRVSSQAESVWSEFTALARLNNAINIGQGYPDSNPPEVLTNALKDVVSNHNYLMHQYTRGFGHVRLVNALAKLYSHLLNVEVDPMTEVTITIGGYNALFSAFFAFLNPGDEAIIIEPYFDCYSSQAEMAGGVSVFVPLRLMKNSASDNVSSADFVLDMDEFESKFNSKTKLLVLNNPNNPLGKVFTRQELMSIADVAKKHNVLVISDEVYEWIVYPGSEMVRFASLPGMWERTITIGSSGKTFSATGWKTGWALAPDHLSKSLRALHQNCVYTCPTLLQEALAIAFEKEFELLGTEKSYFTNLVKELNEKRDRMRKFLSSARMKPINPEGGYFMLTDFSSLHGPFENDTSSEDSKDYKFARWMVNEKKLSCIPPTAFYSKSHRHMGENLIRFCFCKQDSTLKAAEKIFMDWELT